MVPLNSSDLEAEFNGVCEFVFTATKTSVFNNKGCAYFKKGVTEALYCFGQKFRPSRISERAFTVFIQNRPKENLSDSKFYKNWYKRRKEFSPFFLEHFIPQGSLINRCQECVSLEKVSDVLSELEFVIILEEEDKMLRAKGYNSEGRETFQKAEKAYKECGIRLIHIGDAEVTVTKIH